MSTSTRQRVVALFLTSLMVLSVVGFAAASPPSIDTETTNTAQTSDLTDTATQTYNETTTSNLSWSADSNASKVVIKQGNTTLFTATPANYSAANTTGTSDPDVWYYNVSLADDASEYDGFEAGAGENVTLTAVFTNDTSATNPDTSNITFNYQMTDKKALATVGETEGNNKLLSASEIGVFGTLEDFEWFGLSSTDDDTPGAASVEETVHVEPNTSTITVSTTTTNQSDAFAAAIDGQDAGTITPLAYGSVGEENVIFYAEEAGDQEWFDSNETYATISSDGSTITYHNVDVSKAGNMTVSATGNEKAGLRYTRSLMSDYGASITEQFGVALKAIDTNGNPFEE